MTLPQPSRGPQPTRRALLYCASIVNADTEGQLRELAQTSKATLHVSHSGQAFLADMERECDRASLLVLEGNLPDVVSLARRAAAACSLAELVLLATDEEQAAIRVQLGHVTRLGSHWRFLSPGLPALSRALQLCFQRGDQRRAARTTLDRFNTQLAPREEPVDSRQLRQLLISDRILSSVLDATFDAVILVDTLGRVQGFNPSAERMFARNKLQAVSQPATTLATGDWPGNIEELLASHRTDTLTQTSAEVDGRLKHLEVSVTAIIDPSGKQIATSLLVRDSTERVLAEHALRLNEKLAAVGRLASSIAHEINNPLEAVTNLVFVARATAEDETTQHYLDQADHELRRMAAITSQTLRFHKQAVDARGVTANDLLDSVLGLYQARFANAHIAVERRLRARHEVTCFDGEIRQVLNNLVGNALDAMHASGGRLLLRSRDGHHWATGELGVIVTVADTGSGMSAETLARIFEQFYTTKGIMGTGLGLWISAEIVEHHRGTLRARSRCEPGRSGTVFALFLPLDAATR